MYPIIKFTGIKKEFQDLQIEECLQNILKKQQTLISLPRSDLGLELLDIGKLEYQNMEICEIRKLFDRINFVSGSKRINMRVLVEDNQENSIIHKIRNFEDLDVDLIEFLETSEEISEEIMFEKIDLSESTSQETPKFFNEFWLENQETVLYTFKSLTEILDEESFCLDETIELFQSDFSEIEFEPLELKNFNRREVLDFSLIFDSSVIKVKDIRLPAKLVQYEPKESFLQKKIPFNSNSPKRLLNNLNPKNYLNSCSEKINPSKPSDRPTSPHQRLPNKVFQLSESTFSSPPKKQEELLLKKEELLLKKEELLLKKEDELISKKGILKTICQGKALGCEQRELDGYKLTFINCSEEKKNSSKCLQFSDKNTLATYSKPESIPQNPKILVKIYIDVNCHLARCIINSLNMERLNIIGLEIQSDLMDSVDMILSWQSAVKFIFDWRIKEHKTIETYVKTFHEKLFLFDSVLLVYVHSRETSDENIQDYLENYSNYMRSLNIDCCFISIFEISQICNFLNISFRNYFDFLKDVEIWNQVQEEISDVTLKKKDSSINIYAFNVLMACKSKVSLNFTKVANILGLSTHEKFLNLEKILKNMKF